MVYILPVTLHTWITTAAMVYVRPVTLHRSITTSTIVWPVKLHTGITTAAMVYVRPFTLYRSITTSAMIWPVKLHTGITTAAMVYVRPVTLHRSTTTSAMVWPVKLHTGISVVHVWQWRLHLSYRLLHSIDTQFLIVFVVYRIIWYTNVPTFYNLLSAIKQRKDCSCLLHMAAIIVFGTGHKYIQEYIFFTYNNITSTWQKCFHYS